MSFSNDLDSKPLFKGKVYRTKPFKEICDNNPKFEQLFQEFKTYWQYGPHPLFGKDDLFARPIEAIDYHIRHVHFNNQKYTPENSDKDKRGKESNWNNWADLIAMNSPSELIEQRRFKTPTSDSYIVYSVNEHRHSIVMAVISDNAHDKTKKSHIMESFVQTTFETTINKGIKPFPSDCYPFDDAYLNNNQSTI
ncbi:hypothetical protein [Arsenophonus nasoniae]|uniref:Type II toxin-antitoxin system YafO family toxin n=1 Tax=Arsenophonus nasoniae TaxID=638 RepID=A0AA95K505_9GAMM|nr:hypothetical protein [Arsenophonus nasoniae]WGL96495.1 hypothetical protein QE207_08135 [Arsenophonus nasoniae]